jgi:hypothetical protein
MINQLTEVYIKWCDKNNLPNISADEHDRDKLTYEQKTFLNNFIEMWDYQQEVDYFIYDNLKKERTNK